MGRDFAFWWITRREATDALIRMLSRHVDDEGMRELVAPRESHRSFGGARLLFRFEPDEFLLAYQRSLRRELGAPDPEDANPRRELVEVGYFYGTLASGKRWSWVRARACTSDMSMLCLESESVRRTVVQIAVDAGATVLLFDDEGYFRFTDERPDAADNGVKGGEGWSYVLQWWPGSGLVWVPADVFPDDSSPDATAVDRFCDEVQRAIGVRGPSPG